MTKFTSSQAVPGTDTKRNIEIKETKKKMKASSDDFLKLEGKVTWRRVLCKIVPYTWCYVLMSSMLMSSSSVLMYSLLTAGLPVRPTHSLQIPRSLLELLPARQRREVLRTRLPYVWLGQQRQDRLQRVPLGNQHYLGRQTGTETRMGIPDVWRQRRRDNRTERNDRDYSGKDWIELYCILLSKYACVDMKVSL